MNADDFRPPDMPSWPAAELAEHLRGMADRGELPVAPEAVFPRGVDRWDVEDDGNWMSEWDGETVRNLVRLVQRLRDVERAARAFMTDDYSWDRANLGDPGPALVAALRRLDSR